MRSSKARLGSSALENYLITRGEYEEIGGGRGQEEQDSTRIERAMGALNRDLALARCRMGIEGDSESNSTPLMSDSVGYLSGYPSPLDFRSPLEQIGGYIDDSPFADSPLNMLGGASTGKLTSGGRRKSAVEASARELAQLSSILDQGWAAAVVAAALGAPPR